MLTEPIDCRGVQNLITSVPTVISKFFELQNLMLKEECTMGDKIGWNTSPSRASLIFWWLQKEKIKRSLAHLLHAMLRRYSNFCL